MARVQDVTHHGRPQRGESEGVPGAEDAAGAGEPVDGEGQRTGVPVHFGAFLFAHRGRVEQLGERAGGRVAYGPGGAGGTGTGLYSSSWDIGQPAASAALRATESGCSPGRSRRRARAPRR